VLDEKPPCGTPTGFMFGNYGNSTCKYLKKWGNLTKCNVALHFPQWGTYDIPKLVLLHTELEIVGNKTKYDEWEAYFNWNLEAFRRKDDAIAKLQEINESLGNCARIGRRI
jgi:hypothetical protein